MISGPLTHLDLFTGLGGFTLAAEAVGIKTVGFSEIEPYVCKLLKQRWPHIKNYGDITTLEQRERERERERERDALPSCDILTGGFPCQPYSISGPQLGEADPRDRWPSMRRTIEVVRPSWVVAENSSNILRMGFARVVADLESIGYEVGEPLVIPACAIGAHHKRDRAWICAYSNTFRLQRRGKEKVSRFPALPFQPARVFETDRSGRSISAPRMLRSYNGLPNGAHRIKALGNTLMPQIAYQILEKIVRIEAGQLV